MLKKKLPLFLFIQPLFTGKGRNPYKNFVGFFGRFEDTKRTFHKLTDLYREHKVRNLKMKVLKKPMLPQKWSQPIARFQWCIIYLNSCQIVGHFDNWRKETGPYGFIPSTSTFFWCHTGKTLIADQFHHGHWSGILVNMTLARFWLQKLYDYAKILNEIRLQPDQLKK